MLLKAFNVFVALAIASSAVAAGRPIAPTDLLAMARISDPQLSPDGSRGLYTVATPGLAANRTSRDVWIVTIASGETRNLTHNGREGGARWSPDGKTIAFLSTRSKGNQIYLINADGTGDPQQLTTFSSDVDNIVWSPDGRSIAFTADVFPEALQRQGVPSKLIVFPDEGHWILKPQNSAFWYREGLGWLGQYLKPEKSAR